MKHWTTYWFEIEDENKDFYGEQFFTELENGTKEQHIKYANECFPNTEIRCIGRVSSFEAEMMGLDTY